MFRVGALCGNSECTWGGVCEVGSGGIVNVLENYQVSKLQAHRQGKLQM
jgi:hypothetical protein